MPFHTSVAAVIQDRQFNFAPIAWKGMAIIALLVSPLSARADSPPEEFFETAVRPLLVQKCAECHGMAEASGGLRIDSRASLIRGGDSGPAIVPGNIAESRLIRAVRRTGEMPMPPEEKLSEREMGILQRWIELGAPWPASTASQHDAAAAANEHWAFQPIRSPDIPGVADRRWVRTPIDSFVLARLEADQLAASPVADRRSLIRRVSYSLTGLPPTPQEVDRFVADPAAGAYDRLVERLLESPRYGEHWARHWLDVARYSDTKGYVYAREERHWVHSWSYRDWVVDALNRDMPYDRFLLLQIAADQVDDCQTADLAAMGFLTLGRRFLGVRRDIMDDRIDVVCRGTMGLTVSCARCHDHKYDPIPTADYYSLYGVFDSCVERMVPLDDPPADEAFATELQARTTALQTRLEAERQASSDRARQRVADYLFAQSELHKYPANGFDQVFETDDLLPAVVRQWERYLRKAKQIGDPVFRPWHAYAEIPAAAFAVKSAEVSEALMAASQESVHPVVAAAFAEPPESFRQVCDRYGKLLTGQLAMVLDQPDSPCRVPDGPIVQTETFFPTAVTRDLWKLQGEVDRWIIESEHAPPYAVTLNDLATPADPRIFRRGNPIDQGRDVPRQFLSVLAGESRAPFQHGSGRLELAQAIISPANPLTARVIVNRIWAHHFGHGLVSTPSDFGTRAPSPSHPDLLDWLASELIAGGWSLKDLHRQILLSATFRQATSGPDDPHVRSRAASLDPDNRLLWKQNSRRLRFEELRDSQLAVTGELQLQIGGTPQQLFARPYPQRRTLYGLIDRQYLPGTLRVFDFANPDLHTPQRSETTVPQQALFLMNHPLVLERARALARIADGASPQQRVAIMFRHALQRLPTNQEVADAMGLVESAASVQDLARPATAADWQYGYGKLDESADRVTGFTPLPHFTGQAWQGGANWPDPKLGWVQLTATGGHPGNDRDHAAVRRWTAPSSMSIRIRSQLNHEAAPGDGIRAFIVGSRLGVLQSTTIHQGVAELNCESLAVAPGDTVDFVVDIGDVLNSDQYRWSASIEQVGVEHRPVVWDSVTDFAESKVDPLDGWEQLAQVLLCTNEFLFVD